MDDAIRAAAFRYEFDDNEFARHKPNSLMFLAIGRIRHAPTDPSDTLFSQLAVLRPNVRNISSSQEAQGQYVDRQTRDLGLVLAVVDVSMVGENEASAGTEYWLGPLEAGARWLKLLRRDGQWVVVDASPPVMS